MTKPYPTVVAGRFAPSPTGLPHFGTLLAAIASFLHARHTGAQWLLRIEDLDRRREMPGAADAMLRALEAFGLEWDGAPLFQSERAEAYRSALDRLQGGNRIFPCACSRRMLAEAKHGVEGPVYPGTCRNGLAPGRSARSYRLRVDDQPLTVEDRVQGAVTQNLARDVGDFVLLRGDGCFAYQLAVVVDDAFQGVTQVVRGADLLHSTPRQVFLQRQLSLPTPEYLHIPIVLDTAGKKLSKSEGAPAVDRKRPAPLLHSALEVLGQQPPVELREALPRTLLQWAVQHWRVGTIPKQASVPLPFVGLPVS